MVLLIHIHWIAILRVDKIFLTMLIGLGAFQLCWFGCRVVNKSELMKTKALIL